MQDSITEFINSPKGLNEIVIIIIIFALINVSFIFFSLWNTFFKAKREYEKKKRQKEKIDKLSP